MFWGGILRGEVFIIFSLIMAMFILFFGVYIFTISPLTLKSLSSEILYCQSLNMLIDKYFYKILSFYPLSYNYVNASMNRLISSILKYRSLGGLNVGGIDVSLIVQCRYNSTRSYIYCSSTFNVYVGNVYFKRTLNYNLTLSIVGYSFNDSMLCLNYCFIENGLFINPIKYSLWFFNNGSWVEVNSNFKFVDGGIIIYSVDVLPSKVLLDFTGIMDVRITAIVDL